MARRQTEPVVDAEHIAASILLLRGQKVLLDVSLATLYEVETRTLIQAVKRNPKRFPPDFMFRLTDQDVTNLRSQFVISSGHGGRRSSPYAFTEQGVAMLSSVIHSPRAVLVNVEIMRAFVRLRQLLETNADLARKLDKLEKKYDAQFKVVFDAIRSLMDPGAVKSKRPIGFAAWQEPEEP
jgi:hypothetical protein